MNLYLFNEESRASTYGIGTYLQQVVEAMRDNQWKITLIVLQSTKTATIQTEEIEGIRYVYVGTSYGVKSKHYSKRYYRNALQLLRPYICNLDEKTIFHLQQMHMTDLALGLKTLHPAAKVVGTVHYMDWSFALLGNKTKLKELLSQPETAEGKQYAESIAEEKRFLHACDTVVAIARHSYESLQEIYEIPEEKLTLIPNGLKNDYQPYTPAERKAVRTKYGFKPTDKILIFAGRIDQVKGVDLLAEAFASLVTEYPNLRLIIVGDGNVSSIQKKVKPHWAKVTLTGFVDKTTLYELYSIVDIGVLPSLHEEFGYVALEMMMMGLPLVVSKTTGLKEIVVDGETGFVVSLPQEIHRLTESIEKLLLSPMLQKTFSIYSRNRFMSLYRMNIFRHRITSLYEATIPN